MVHRIPSGVVCLVVAVPGRRRLGQLMSQMELPRFCGQFSVWRSRSLLIIGFGELVVLGVVGLVGASGVGVLGRLMAVAGFFGGGVPVLGF